MGEEKMKLVKAVNDVIRRLIEEHGGIFEKLETMPFDILGEGVIFNVRFSLNTKNNE